MAGVKWGWMTACCHPGCEATVAVWNEKGTPPLKVPDKWFFQAWRHSNRSAHEAWDHYDYKAFCPEHAESAFRWVAEHGAWRKQRWTVGRGWFHNLLKKFSPNFAKQHTGQYVERWIRKHPEPDPPWNST